MCDEYIHPGLVKDTRLSRRTFGLIAVAAAGAAGTACAAPKVAVDEKDVSINTSDGTADAVLFAPTKAGKYPAVLMWPDIMGLRPAFRDMGRRLAGEGYVVLVPNPFYRSKKAPVIEGTIDFSNPAQRELLTGYRKAMTNVPGDAAAYLAFLDAQPKTDRQAQGRRAGLLHGRRARVPDGRDGCQPDRRRRQLPRREWPGHEGSDQPTPSDPEDQRHLPRAPGTERRRPATAGEG